MGSRATLAAPDHQGNLVSREYRAILALLAPSLTSSLSSTKSSSPKAPRKDPHQTRSPTCKLRWAQWAHEAPQACEAHLDPRDLWARREITVTLDHLDLLASWVREASKVCPGKKEKPVGMERQEPLVLLVHQAKEGCLACQEFQDPKVTVDFLAWMAPREKWEDLG